MKEITRIHIAKVAYDIEVDAKKEIEQYIRELEQFADDPEILTDIEIRITELLAERGVPEDGVITKDDVEAVRGQLGEPSEFASDGVTDSVGVAHVEFGESRKIYRDKDNAIIGGVLAGFAKFFGIDPLWVRLVFIVILLGSFGTALVVYLLLWLIIPPATSAADKLRMSGKPVTLASIKELAGTEESRNHSAEMVRRFIANFTGVALIVAGIGGLITIAFVMFGLRFGLVDHYSQLKGGWIAESWWFLSMMGLFVLSGLLFSALCFLLANAVFRRQWTKRTATAVIAVIAAGLIAFSGGIATGMYGYTEERDRVREMQESVTGDIPVPLSSVKNLIFDSGEDTYGGLIQYHVSNRHYYELEALPTIEPTFELVNDGTSLLIRLTTTDEDAESSLGAWLPWRYRTTPVLHVYGPAVESIDVKEFTRDIRYENDDSQSTIDIRLGDSAEFRLNGSYDRVKVTAGAHASAALESAAIGELTTDGGRVTAGVVRSLIVSQPDVCAEGNTEYSQYVRVRAVSGGRMTYNGNERKAESFESDCGQVVIRSELQPEFKEDI